MSKSETAVPFESSRSRTKDCTLSNDASHADLNLSKITAYDRIMVKQALKEYWNC
jgi:hypothetical protein